VVRREHPDEVWRQRTQRRGVLRTTSHGELLVPLPRPRHLLATCPTPLTSVGGAEAAVGEVGLDGLLGMLHDG
jgi:hypothetical protein